MPRSLTNKSWRSEAQKAARRRQKQRARLRKKGLSEEQIEEIQETENTEQIDLEGNDPFSLLFWPKKSKTEILSKDQPTEVTGMIKIKAMKVL